MYQSQFFITVIFLLVHSEPSSSCFDRILDVNEGKAVNVTKNTNATDEPNLKICKKKERK